MSQRITVRLPDAQLAHMDALVELGQYATRTEVVRHALRVFFEQQGQEADKTIASAKGLQELQELAAILKSNRDLIDRL